jgi:predicted ATPase/transcriptional regulator with XRE-family HTH domain
LRIQNWDSMTEVPLTPTSTDLAFGQWLKRRRKALGLTQPELAQQVSCAVVSLKKIEAGDLQPSEHLAEGLAAALGVPAADSAAFIRFARTALSAAPAPFHLPPDALHLPPPVPATVRSNLPAPLTSLIGRGRDIAAGVKLLRRADVRLVTLVGPPGAGKTRLSIHIASALAQDFAGGVYFVELASATDSDEWVTAVAETLGLTESPGQSLFEAVLAFVRERAALLVLDNFEQVLSAAPLVTELLTASPDLKIIITSREALHFYGEHQFPVGALELPDVHRLPPLDSLALYPAIELFVQRARAVRPTFELSSNNALTVANLCADLDGLPLALEMAAARVQWQTVEVLLSQLSRRLTQLAGGMRDLTPRQQTLRGAIDWSYDLLTEEEQRAFCGLAVFVGGCSPEAAERVLHMDASPLTAGLSPVLESLVNKSLVRHSPAYRPPANAPRLWMLETIREYALEKLEAGGEAEAVRERHARYYLTLAQTASAQLTGAQQAQWLGVLDGDHNNFRAALHWCMAHDAETGLRLAAALYPFWQMRGYLTEGRGWFNQLLQAGMTAPPLVRAAALRDAGVLADGQGDIEQAIALAEESVAIFRAEGETRGLAQALNELAGAHLTRNDYARTVTLAEEALALFRRLGAPLGEAGALTMLGLAAKEQGDYARAVACHEAALALHRASGNARGMAAQFTHLSFNAFWMGDYARAEQMARQSLGIGRTLNNRNAMATALSGVGAALHRQGDWAGGWEAFVEGLGLYRETGNKSGQAMMLNDMGALMVTQGGFDRAVRLYREALPLALEIGDRRRAAFSLEGLALAVVQRAPGAAAQLLGAADTLRQQVCAPLPPSERPTWSAAIAHIRQTLGDEAYRREWARGKTLAPEQAAALATLP